ncbi:MAG: hypothetical protein HYX78_07750 [Armatimonadetes bacterium]|nr:hypothetical protein [Armatimonadota bacterium]
MRVNKKSAAYLILAAALVVLGSVAASAQVDILPPDAGVHGSGAIALHNDSTISRTVGLFDIKVAQYGDALHGGFRFAEVTADGVRQHTVASKDLKSLKFLARNHAVITAVGYLDSWHAEITLEVLDDVAGDWLHIVAKPINSPLDFIYERAGGVIKGDIVVFHRAEVTAYAKGEGVIAVGRNLGRFAFHAESSSAGVNGKIYYAEYSPWISSMMPWPRVRIEVPHVAVLTVEGNKAVLAGHGAINGHPAKVTVIAVDNSMVLTPLPVPDEFTIHAITESGREYKASGPLRHGDIVVGTANTR